MSENKLTTTEWLRNIPTLKYLNLSCNHLTTFSSTHLAQLTRLDLSSNAIANSSALTPLALRNLTDLDLSCNQLETIDKGLFFHTRALQRLDISGNAIKRLNRSIFYNLINLEHLNLAGNRIDVIENDTFSYLLNLQFLDLSQNEIGPDSIRALQGIPALIGLSLAHNARLGTVMHEFVASWSLKELDASGTGLCRIPTALAQSVKSLKLANNLLNVIRSGDLDSYPLLQQLILSDNLISDIEDDALGRLELLSTLFLDRNQLVRVPVSLPSNLNHLHLQNNAIYELQPGVFRNLKNLRTLNLAGNRIAYLPELPLPGLVLLNVQRNDLKGLSQSVVKTSPNLSEFLLENNPVRCADLLGIAEWAKPCRDEMLFEDSKDSDGDDSGDEFEIFGRFTTGGRRSRCTRESGRTLAKMATKIALLKSQCRNENLINPNAPNRLKSDQTTVKHPLEGDKIGPTADATPAPKIGMMNDKPRSGEGAKNGLLKNFTMIADGAAAVANDRNKVNVNGTKKAVNLDVNLSGKSFGNATAGEGMPALQRNFHNNTISDANRDKAVNGAKKVTISTPKKKVPQKKKTPLKTATPAADPNPMANNDKLGNSSSVNKVVNLTAITAIVNVTGNERDEASDKSDTEEKKANRNSLIQTDSMARTSPASLEQPATPRTSDKLVEITVTTTTVLPSSSTLTSKLMLEKYDQTSTTTMGTQTTTNESWRHSSFISNKNNSVGDDNDHVEQTDTAEGNLERNVPPSTTPLPPVSTTTTRRKVPRKSYNVTGKTRKNVNHMKMKLKFNRDQLHDDEFRDDFDIDSMGPLGGYDHGVTSHGRKGASKFSIYDSIYLASLKNANFKPFHHAVHVLNSSRTATPSAEASNTDPLRIPATSVETSSKILPQEWNDVRPVSSGGSHYGLFIVVGATLGMLISFGLFHLYYCRVRGRGRGQHLHGHHPHYRPAHASGMGSCSSNHNSTHHRYSYAFEQDDSDERLTYTISTSVLDTPDDAGSTVHHQQQQDVLHMDVLNPLKSKPLLGNLSSGSSSRSSSTGGSAASSCFDGHSPAASGGGGELRLSPRSTNPNNSSSRNHPNTSNNHNDLARVSHRDGTIDRW
ncbi:hypothetical protein pipiens_020415 [Culex pipiens pipiens]|uniref:Uncharacterized protein n=1 Tax=Culex pipiens pipiens TaxID=38569 RepID=A0ABD1CDU1_CULPP